MTQREINKYLTDIAECCMNIRQFTMNKTFDEYCDDLMIRSAVERQFEIIGEALNRLLRRDESFKGKIGYAQEIIDFRNRLSHGYDFVKNDIVWGIIQEFLPQLEEEVSKIMKEKQ